MEGSRLREMLMAVSRLVEGSEAEEAGRRLLRPKVRARLEAVTSRERTATDFASPARA